MLLCYLHCQRLLWNGIVETIWQRTLEFFRLFVPNGHSLIHVHWNRCHSTTDNVIYLVCFVAGLTFVSCVCCNPWFLLLFVRVLSCCIIWVTHKGNVFNQLASNEVTKCPCLQSVWSQFYFNDSSMNEFWINMNLYFGPVALCYKINNIISYLNILYLMNVVFYGHVTPDAVPYTWDVVQDMFTFHESISDLWWHFLLYDVV